MSTTKTQMHVTKAIIQICCQITINNKAMDKLKDAIKVQKTENWKINNELLGFVNEHLTIIQIILDKRNQNGQDIVKEVTDVNHFFSQLFVQGSQFAKNCLEFVEQIQSQVSESIFQDACSYLAQNTQLIERISDISMDQKFLASLSVEVEGIDDSECHKNLNAVFQKLNKLTNYQAN